MDKYILAIDLGTTLIKFVLFNRDLALICEHSMSYRLDTKTEFIEFEAQNYWNRLQKGIGEILQKSGIDSKRVASISLSSQAETLVLLDQDNQPLRKAISWLDNRSQSECQQIKNQFSPEESYHITGQPEVITTWPVTKIIWIKKNEPDIFKRVHKFLLLKDYIVYKFTGRFMSEYTVYNFSYYFNIITKQYWPQMLEFAGIDADQLPQLVEPGYSVKAVDKAIVEKFGFNPGLNLNLGALDQMAGMIGVGNISPGTVSETTGTVLAICTLLQQPLFSPARIPCHYSAIKDKYMLLPICESGGISLEWFKQNFYPGRSYSLVDQQAAKVPPGSGGLIFLPYITGVNSPEYNARAQGVFYGITIKHGKPHFARAVLESIAFMLKKNLDYLESKLSLDIKQVISLGGGAHSPLWNQIKADVLGREIKITSSSQPTALGAAMLSAVEMGWFANLNSLANSIIGVKETYKPQNQGQYSKSYQMFLKLYQNLEPLFRP